MTQPGLRSPWARLALVLLALMWAGAGWLIVLDGGYTAGVKRSTVTVRVDGAAGVLMAGIFFALAAIALAAVLQSLRAGRWLHLASLALLLVPPVVCLLRG